MAKRTSKTAKRIENQSDENGQVTHVKCSNCCWKMVIDGPYDSDATIREIYASFSAHDCEQHRIGLP